MAAQPACALLNLPFEVRDLIFSLVLSPSDPHIAQYEEVPAHLRYRLDLAILRTSKAIRQQALAAWHREHTFITVDLDMIDKLLPLVRAGIYRIVPMIYHGDSSTKSPLALCGASLHVVVRQPPRADTESSGSQSSTSTETDHGNPPSSTSLVFLAQDLMTLCRVWRTCAFGKWPATNTPLLFELRLQDLTTPGAARSTTAQRKLLLPFGLIKTPGECCVLGPHEPAVAAELQAAMAESDLPLDERLELSWLLEDAAFEARRQQRYSDALALYHRACEVIDVWATPDSIVVWAPQIWNRAPGPYVCRYVAMWRLVGGIVTAHYEVGAYAAAWRWSDLATDPSLYHPSSLLLPDPTPAASLPLKTLYIFRSLAALRLGTGSVDDVVTQIERLSQALSSLTESRENRPGLSRSTSSCDQTKESYKIGPLLMVLLLLGGCIIQLAIISWS